MPLAVDGDLGAGDGASVAAAIALPLWHGGFGLCVVSEREADAARLSVAALTQAAIEGACPSFRPLDRPLCFGLPAHESVSSTTPPARCQRRRVPAIVHDVLPGVQCQLTRSASSHARW
jgi:hypothetical protein